MTTLTLWSAERCWPWISAVRVVARLGGGFAGPMREGALIAVVLRRLGLPAFLVIGHEPLPVVAGRRRLVVWVQVGATVVTGGRSTLPYPELVRYPAQSTTSCPAAVPRPAGVQRLGGAG